MRLWFWVFRRKIMMRSLHIVFKSTTRVCRRNSRRISSTSRQVIKICLKINVRYISNQGLAGKISRWGLPIYFRKNSWRSCDRLTRNSDEVKAIWSINLSAFLLNYVIVFELHTIICYLSSRMREASSRSRFRHVI